MTSDPIRDAMERLLAALDAVEDQGPNGGNVFNDPPIFRHEDGEYVSRPTMLALIAYVALVCAIGGATLPALSVAMQAKAALTVWHIDYVPLAAWRALRTAADPLILGVGMRERSREAMRRRHGG